jgi:hypothetical protein
MSNPTFIFGERNLTIRWVDFKTTHQLDGCTQNLQMPVHYLGPVTTFTRKPITLSIRPIFDSPTLYLLKRASHNASVGQSQQNPLL